jgi:uncharacterized tellurite resistance protein B-like protein
VEEAERTVMRAALQSTFDLGAEETDELVQLAEAQSKSAASLYEFTSLVDAGLDASQKKRIVELLWLVAFADGRKDAHEEHLVRRIAGLLHVPHPDFIDAKRRASERRISAPAEPERFADAAREPRQPAGFCSSSTPGSRTPWREITSSP